MQGQEAPKSNVVSLFNTKQKTAQNDDAGGQAPMPTGDKESFTDVMARNMKNQERMAKERASANKSVLRSYRIKH